MNLPRGPFGGVDEQAATDQFEELVGGRAAADRIDQLYRDSHPGISTHPFKPGPSREEIFRTRAVREGYSQQAIDAYLQLSRA